MEISSAVSNLQAALVTTKALNTQQAHQAEKTQPAKDSKVEEKATVAEPKKNDEIKDKSVISKEALELLKNEFGTNNTHKKDSANKTDLTTIVKEIKNHSAKSLAYKNALKSYTAVKS